MFYSIRFYDDAVEAQVLALPRTLLVPYLSLADLMVINGPNLGGGPHPKAMGDGLFEMRLKGAEGIARVLYCTLVGRRIVVLHSFVKKTDKTPSQDLLLSRKRLKVLQ